MGLCAVGPYAPCQRWLHGLFFQPRSSSETPTSPFSNLGCKEKMDIIGVYLRGGGGTYRSHKREEVYGVEWPCILSCLSPQHQEAGQEVQNNPALQSHVHLIDMSTETHSL